MSEFEYFSVVVSVVLGLGIADILRFFGDTLANLGRRKSYWIQLLWLAILLKTHVDVWWALWAFREQIEGTPALVYLVITPALLFIATRILVTSIQNDVDVEAVYFERRRPFFAMVILLSVWGLVIGPSAPLTFMVVAVTLVAMALYLACMFVTNRRFHAGVILVVAAGELTEVLAIEPWLL